MTALHALHAAHVTELSLFRSTFNVMTACAGMYRGTAWHSDLEEMDSGWTLDGSGSVCVLNIFECRTGVAVATVCTDHDKPYNLPGSLDGVRYNVFCCSHTCSLCKHLISRTSFCS